MSGKRARLHVVVVVGGDLHALRALDHEGRMPGVGDADLVAGQRRQIEGGRNRPAAAGPPPCRGSSPSFPAWRIGLGGDGCAWAAAMGSPISTASAARSVRSRTMVSPPSARHGERESDTDFGRGHIPKCDGRPPRGAARRQSACRTPVSQHSGSSSPDAAARATRR